MFSKSLFKQSCKANGVMWTIITVAVCFMLCCVMLIAGNGDLSGSKRVVENAVIQGELTAQVQKRGIRYYEISDSALAFFDKKYAEAAAAGNPLTAYAAAAGALQTEYYPALLEKSGIDADSEEGQELMGIIFYTLNPMQANGTHPFDEFYTAQGEAAPRYEILLAGLGSDGHAREREKYAMENSAVFLAGNMIKSENIAAVLDALSSYGVTEEQYREFGFGDYKTVKGVAEEAVVEYRARLEYEAEKSDGKGLEEIKTELVADMASGLLAMLPKDVSDALQEIGQADLYGTLVGSIFFKMAGLLLPIIYMIMSANALIAGQVDSGSMAYILSSGTKRKEVTFTQAVFLVGSLFAMFLCTTAASLICYAIVDVETGLNAGKLLLINFGAFLVMFAMSGISFLASCVFNRSKHSMAIGGGLNMFFLVATMLGLFGSPVLPSIVRMEALNAFNYVSIISLFDVVSILEGTMTFLWKWAILLVGGLACYFIGAKKFEKKDLPL